ncbi:MAG: TIGR00730 family Rossman fold protein [Mangrovibacterium sp.]
MKNICVFASSSDALKQIYKDEALLLSQLLGEHQLNLVNGGANVGLMEEMLKKAQACGAQTIGIIPEKMEKVNLISSHIDELIISSDMKERKAIMRQRSDAFIALAGGFGTLEEILEVITLKQLDYHNKPIVFINTNGFYDDLFRQFEKSYEENFAKPVYQTLYHIAGNAHEAMEHILNYTEKTRVSKWFEVPNNSLTE